MTLKKVEQKLSFPFLRPYEAEFTEKAEIVSEPRTMQTQFGEGNVVDVKLKKVLPKADYDKLKKADDKLTEDDIQKRTSDPTRTWFMNGTSFNHCIDLNGTKESDWLNKEVEFQVEKQMVKGELTKVIYLKGSVDK